MKKTLVIGASENQERYAFKAITALRKNNIETVAIGLKKGTVAGVDFHLPGTKFENIDTVTLYIGPRIQPEYYDYIISLHPRRVIFNPGTENPEFYKLLALNDIEVEESCTLVMLRTGLF